MSQKQVGIASFGSPAAIEFRRTARQWISRSILKAWGDGGLGLNGDEVVAVRRDWDRILFDGGYAGLAWPSEYGGRGLGLIEEAIFFEECARANAPEGLGRIGRLLAGPMIIAYGTESQKAKYLPAILEGREYWCQGYSEPSAGSDLPAMITTAVRDGEVYRITGRKIWTSHAQMSNRCFLLARTSLTLPRGKNISIFLVDLDQDAIEIAPIVTAAGDRHFNEVSFDGAVANINDRVGEENEGWSLVRRSLVHERGISTALTEYIELSRQYSLLDACCGRAGKRNAEPEKLRALGMKCELVRWHVYRVSEMLTAGQSATRELSVLKLYWTELLQEVAGYGLEVSCDEHFGYWSQHYLRARVGTIAGGTSEIQRNTIARLILAEKSPLEEVPRSG